jgi:hypothetical protein
VNAGEYETGRTNVEAAVAVFCTKVRKKIEELWLDVEFSDPKPTQFQTGWQTFICKCMARPGPDIFLFSRKGDEWRPRGERLKQTANHMYEVRTFFSDHPGPQTLHVIKTSEIGMLWIANYRYFADKFKNYPPIFTKAELPREFISLASIEVEVLPKPP